MPNALVSYSQTCVYKHGANLKKITAVTLGGSRINAIIEGTWKAINLSQVC